MKKHAKIYGKISDRKCDVEFIQSIYDKGFNVVWLNTAHQEESETIKVIENTRKVSDNLSIIIDTKGPEIRMHIIEEDAPVPVTKGQILYITGDVSKSGENIVHVDYPTFADELSVGKHILIDDGEIGLTVLAIEDGLVKCHVDNTGGGKIKRKKSVNVPNTHFSNLQALTEKDKRFIEFAAQSNEIDYVIHSFVRSKEDVLNIRAILDKYDTKCGIIAKIENIAGVENTLNGEILELVDGVMVARGDLAVEVPAYEVPVVQKKIIRKCLEMGKTVMVATQVLHTMIENPRPTRAEASDIVNALLDGADIVTLSGETAYGEYPVQAVEFMTKTMIATEKERNNVTQELTRVSKDIPEGKIAHDAVAQMEGKNVKAILIPTTTNITVRALVTFHLDPYIYAVSDDKMTMRKVSAHSYGVEGVHATGSKNEQIIAGLEAIMKGESCDDSAVVAVVDGDNGASEISIDTISNLKTKYSA